MKGLSSTDSDKIFKRSSQNRNDSGELDVFEAARYFSGYNEPPIDDNYTSTYSLKYNNYTREENRRRSWGLGRGRISLDLPIRSCEPVHHHHPQDHHVLEKHEVFTMKEKIGNVKHKQPSSPGGKIASFLSSLFNQSGSKKNKSKSSKSKSTAQTRDEDESPGGWRRRRRSSISHFLMSSSRSSNTASTTTTTNSSSKSLFSSSSSGFRTPPPCLNTPTKNYREYMSHVDQTDNKNNNDLIWLDEKLKLIETLSEGQRIWSEDGRRKTNGGTVAVEDDDDDDDGAESDSSSDLFELQNYDLSYGGLPVYETTSVDTIKKCAA